MAAQEVNIGLGTPKVRFEGSSRLRGGLFLLSIMLFFGCFWLIPMKNPRTGEPETSAFFGFGVIFIILGFVIFYFTSLHYRGLYVQTFSEGLARIKGNNIQTVRWDEIASVWQKIVYAYQGAEVISKHYTYTIETIDKRKLKFSNEVKNVYDLGQMIVQETTMRLLPQVMRAYETGETVSFGAFRVNKQGISVGRKSVDWAEIEGAQIKDGYVIFKKQGIWSNWVRIPAPKIPNLVLFLTLIDKIIGVRGQIRSGVNTPSLDQVSSAWVPPTP